MIKKRLPCFHQSKKELTHQPTKNQKQLQLLLLLHLHLLVPFLFPAISVGPGNCMAANSKSARGIASLGKRVVNQIWTATSSSRSPSSYLRRAAHTSVYDKNLDEHVRPTTVPDEVIQPQSDKYWAPHPQTGVFGPATEQNSVAAGGSHPSNSQNSVLEEKAWFRPTSLEDLEKPHHH